MVAQQPHPPSPAAYPLPIDRGAVGLWQSLQKLKTRASLMMVVAHPDDEDGGMLAYESRGEGVDTTLLTLTRGEGGQNVMTSDYWDQLGVLRTQELLAAGNYYGVHQYFTRLADFGFSKTLDETLQNWGHDRVLYDVVRQVRLTRPLVISSVFAGYVSDGHGHHQTAGLMAQEAYKLAGDPSVFPDQIAAGLKPWSPLKVYIRVPFARVTEKGIFDYATAHWEKVNFKNYVTGTYFQGVPDKTVKVPIGSYSPLFATSYLALARQGLAMQKTQNDDVGTPLPGPASSAYHLYASRVSATLPVSETGFFEGVDVSLVGIAQYAPASTQTLWKQRLAALQVTVEEAIAAYDATNPTKSAAALARGLQQSRALLQTVQQSDLPAEAKYNMQHELEIKESQFNTALGQSLGVAVVATIQPNTESMRSGPYGDMRGNQPTFQYAIAGQSLAVNIHIANQGTIPIQVERATLQPNAGDWNVQEAATGTQQLDANSTEDVSVKATVPDSTEPTKPYFTRPTVEQPYYDIQPALDLGLPTSPYPLAARVVYVVNGVKADANVIVQTTHVVNAMGPVLEPLLIGPAISVNVSPQAGIVSLEQKQMKLHVTLMSNVKGPAEGEVQLHLPQGWTSSPATEHFHTSRDGEQQSLVFQVMPQHVEEKPYTLTAVATYQGKEFREGFTTTGWPGLRPYPYYRPATFQATGVDVKIAPGLRVAYVMGTGDDVPMALEDMGMHLSLLSAQEIAGGDLSGYDAVIIGIRAYDNRPELHAFNDRLLEYVKAGGVVVTQYQTGKFDHNYGPYPISVPGDAEKVVDENSKVSLLLPNDALLQWPNQITEKDFQNWVEERGHGFAKTWDANYIALSEMHDAGQEPQKGGLLYARYGKGYYIYTAYAFFREMPEGVPGSFRILANLISAGKNAALLSQK